MDGAKVGMNPHDSKSNAICSRCHQPIDGMAVLSEGKDYRCLPCYQQWVGQGPGAGETKKKIQERVCGHAGLPSSNLVEPRRRERP